LREGFDEKLVQFIKYWVESMVWNGRVSNIKGAENPNEPLWKHAGFFPSRPLVLKQAKRAKRPGKISFHMIIRAADPSCNFIDSFFLKRESGH
jgi:hypothetical protein